MKRNLTQLIAICLLIASVLCLLPAMEAPVSAAATPYVSFTNIGAQQPIVDMWLIFDTYKSGGPYTVTFETKVENIKKITNPLNGEGKDIPYVITYVEGTKYQSTTKQSVEGMDDGATSGNYASQGSGWKAHSFKFENVGTINVSGQDITGNLFRTYFWYTAGTVYIRNVLIKNAAGTVIYNMNTDPDLTALLTQMQANGQTETDISNVASINPDCLWCAPAHFGFSGDYYATVHLDDGTQTTTTTRKTVLPSGKPTTNAPTTAKPTTAAPTTAKPTTAAPTTAAPTTAKPTTAAPTTAKPTTAAPTTVAPTTAAPTTAAPTTAAPTTAAPTTTATTKKPMVPPNPTTAIPTTAKPTTAKATTKKPATVKPTVAAPTVVQLTANKTSFVTNETVHFIFSCDAANVSYRLWIFNPDGTQQQFENLNGSFDLPLDVPGSYAAVLQAYNDTGSAQSEAFTFQVTAPTEAPTTAPTTAPTEAPTTAPTQAPTVAPTQPAPQPAQNNNLPTWALILILALTAGMAVTITLLVVKKKGA